MEALLRRAGLAGRLHQAQAVIVWAEVVGQELASHTRALDVRDGVLRVAVRSSAWSAQLSFLRSDLLERLNARVGAPGLSAIRFTIGSVGSVTEFDVRNGPAVSTSRSVQLSGADLMEIDAVAARVSDPEMRSAWRRMLVAAVARRRRLGG